MTEITAETSVSTATSTVPPSAPVTRTLPGTRDVTAPDAGTAETAAMVDAALGDLDLALGLELDVHRGLDEGAPPAEARRARAQTSSPDLGPGVRDVLAGPDGTAPPEVSSLVSSLLLAYARRRGLPVAAAAVAYPLHDPRVAERLVADLARAQGTSEAVVRLTFGQPTPR